MNFFLKLNNNYEGIDFHISILTYVLQLTYSKALKKNVYCISLKCQSFIPGWLHYLLDIWRYNFVFKTRTKLKRIIHMYFEVDVN